MCAATHDALQIHRRRPEPGRRRHLRRLAVGLGVFVFMSIAMAQAVQGSTPSGYQTVTVRPGDTVWSIAAARYPRADTREKVQEILRANSLTAPDIRTGDQLRVPIT